MAETDDEWVQTLNKMTQLKILSEAASTGAKEVSDWRIRMVGMVSKMTQKLIAIQSKINTIKDQGNTAKKACQDLIKTKYGPQQEAIIKDILENINTMTNIEEVNKLIGDMSSIVGRVRQNIGIVDGDDPAAADAADAAADAADAAAKKADAAAAADAKKAAAADAAEEKVISGGYTFGRSKRRGKKRRKRTKKSRKKGSNKK